MSKVTFRYNESDEPSYDSQLDVLLRGEPTRFYIQLAGPRLFLLNEESVEQGMDYYVTHHGEFSNLVQAQKKAEALILHGE